MTTTKEAQAQDPAATPAPFISTLFSYYIGGCLTLLVDIGNRTGLFAAAAQGPATSEELASRAGLHERYVREWLAALVTGGTFTYDSSSGTYTLPPEHAAFLTGETALNYAPHSRMVTHAAHHIADLTKAFREGGGVPYEKFRPEFTDLMDRGSRYSYDQFLIGGYLPAADGLVERLQAGILVADLGCGTGHAANVMAQAFPASQFVGYDLAPDAIARAEQEASAMGLTNVRFEVRDVLTIPNGFDLITAFDAIHDQADPAGVLLRAYRSLERDGVFFMVDIDASSNLEDNVGNPMAPFLYSISVLHCMTVSLARDGAGLGTAWGRQLATRMLEEAGFTRVEVRDTPPEDPANIIYVCQK